MNKIIEKYYREGDSGLTEEERRVIAILLIIKPWVLRSTRQPA